NWTVDPTDPAAPPEPPPPPSAEDAFREAMDRKLIPELEVNLNPPDGLVAMDTWLWFEHDNTVRVEVPLDPWLGVLELNVEYAWDMGVVDGYGDVVRSSRSGAYGDPSATYLYERACYCTVTVTATWTGTFTASYQGQAVSVEQLEPIPFTRAEPYDVYEAQAINIPG
ncbi:MAG: hypothetical protein ACRD0U_06330, partial [Acidimicrobiales bacterium]